MTSPIKLPISKTAKAIRYASIGVFIVSLACPCFDTEKATANFGDGAGLLLMGIFWFMFLSPGIIWVANPLLWVSWFSTGKKPVRSFITSIIAILLALCFLFYKDFLMNEGGGTSPITAHRIGYWLWLTSMLIMVLGNLYLQLSDSNTAPHPTPNV